MLKTTKLVGSMVPFFLLAVVLTFSGAAAEDRVPSAGERWEKALLAAKARGEIPGPRPGQKCLWSKRLGACLWYTPGKFNLER